MLFMSESLFHHANFRLHWLSGVIAQTGSFFTLVALPWLVLSITHNDPVAMSSVQAAISLPFGFFILFGGTLVDRLSPLRVLIVSRALFVAVMSALALSVYLGFTPLWMIYLCAFLLGLLGAMGVPAAGALLPSLLPKSQLGMANGIVMGSGQLAQIVGPIAAGWLIWLIKSLRDVPDTQYDLTSLAVAFAVDALAVLVSLLLTLRIQVSGWEGVKQKVTSMALDGLAFCWRDQQIRIVLAYLMLVSFFLQGPMLASLPFFTKVNLGLAEGAYGTLYAMTGVGTLLGAGVAVWSSPDAKRLGLIVLLCDFSSGLLFYCLGQTQGPWAAGLCLFLMGIAAGMIMVAGTTWFQQRTPEEYMGRVMSVLLFSITGLIPLSALLTGFLMQSFSVNQIMGATGLLVCSVSVIGLLFPRIRNMGYGSANTGLA